LYIMFLCEYPMEKKRFVKHLNFLLSNLEYPTPSGRRTLLDTLWSFLGVVDDKIASTYSGFMFLPIVVAFANETDPECRKYATLLLERLIEICWATKRDWLLSTVTKWLHNHTQNGVDKNGDAEPDVLELTALRLVAMFSKVLKSKLREHSSSLLSHLSTYISAAATPSTVQGKGEWKRIYLSLLAVEEILKSSQ